MGSGSWTTQAFASYTTSTKGMSADTYVKSANLNVQDIYKSRSLDPILNPRNVMRECRDSEEHPNTLPVILALDVTGSMGQTAVKVAQKLNEIMTELYEDESIPDIEFCVMGIGDLTYDYAPIQISQFESDIRIAEQMDKVYFEFGGGGNTWESYTAAWYMGINHCKLDCWDRGQKGIIITLGDECPNPYLPYHSLKTATGDTHLEKDIETKDLLLEALEKYNVYHISVSDSSSHDWHNNRYNLCEKWKDLLGDNFHVCGLDDLAQDIIKIIIDNVNNKVEINEVTW